MILAHFELLLLVLLHGEVVFERRLSRSHILLTSVTLYLVVPSVRHRLRVEGCL